MNTKLLSLNWPTDNVLFPGTRQTESPDPLLPWQCMNEIVPGIFLTCEQELANRTVSLAKGIALIMNLCASEYLSPYKVCEPTGPEGAHKYRTILTIEQFVNEIDEYTSSASLEDMKLRKVFLLNIAAIDAPNYEIDRHFPETCAIIEMIMANRAKVVERGAEGSSVPSIGVHCMVGVSRSASVVIAYLMKTTCVGRDEVVSFVRTIRPVVNPNPGFQQQLFLWQETDGKRIFDDFSAELVANEVESKKNVVEYVRRQLPAIFKHSKCAGERQYFGLVVAKGLASSECDDDAAVIYREVKSYITAAVDNEVYADSPNFFGYVSEIANSIQRYVPSLLFKSSPVADHTGLVWSDVFYSRVTKDIGRSGFVKDTYDTVRAFCSLLEAIHVKQLSNAPLQLLHQPTGNEEGPEAAPACLALSFPFSPFVAPYAEGFVQFSELNTLEEQFPAQGRPFDAGTVSTLTSTVADMFLTAFLVSTTGVASFLSRDNEESRLSDTNAASDPNQRWSPTSRLLFLQSDIEVQVFERLVSAPSGAEMEFADLVAAVAACTVEQAALSAARKAAAAVVAYRLILEAADRFVSEAYSDRVEDGGAAHGSDVRFPLAHVRAAMDSFSTAYSGKFGSPCELDQFFRMELEPLLQCEVMSTRGVWSLFQKE